LSLWLKKPFWNNYSLHAIKGELAERATPPVRAMEREMILEELTETVFSTFH
jgi:hypothetical protein